MGLTAKLGAFNGTLVGTILGLATYVRLADASAASLLIATPEIVAFAVAAAASANVLAFVKLFPTGPVVAGALSGIVGGVLAYVIPTYVSVAITLPSGAFGGFLAAFVMSVFLRFLPGL